jgi:hypothetical protein
VSVSDCGCIPDAAELARLTENVQAGRYEAFVGTGDPDTVLSCPHGSWRLGDVLAAPPKACTELTKAGTPCKGTPGDDGLCAAHKPKGDADAAALDPDPPQEDPGGAGQGEGREAGQGEGQGAPGGAGESPQSPSQDGQKGVPGTP